MPRADNTSSIMVRNAASIMCRGYGWLTQNFKRIWMGFCHEGRATRRLDRARESFEASNAKWRMRRVGPRPAARPLRLARAVLRERCRRRRAGTGYRASSRTRGVETLAVRHAHGAQHAGEGVRRHLVGTVAGRGR